MRLNELFGLLKKKDEEPPEMGSREERKSLAKQILDTYVKLYSKDSTFTDKIRKLLKKDIIDVVELERNKIWRETLTRSIVNSAATLQDLTHLAAGRA